MKKEVLKGITKCILIFSIVFMSCNIIHLRHIQTADEYVNETNYKLRLYGKWKIQYMRHEITADQYIILMQDEINNLIRK